MKLRIKFSKTGSMKYISHLDVMRYFQKAIRRAGISIAYSEGFNPHQIMSFALPLGLGLTSEGEYMDIEVAEAGLSAEILACLNDQMVEGVEVLRVVRLPEGAKNAMSIVAAADYQITFKPEYRPKDWPGFQAAMQSFLGQATIAAQKENKKKKETKQVDLKPLIYRTSFQDEALYLQLASGSDAYLKPELFMQTFAAYAGLVFPPFSYQVHRLELYAKSMDDGIEALVPLESLGEEIG